MYNCVPLTVCVFSLCYLVHKYCGRGQLESMILLYEGVCGVYKQVFSF